MKKILLLFTLLLTFAINGKAQEQAKPLTDTEVQRRVSSMDIEGTYYDDVIVTLKCVSPDHFITDNYKVKITVKDSSGKKIWKKSFKNVYLYVFSNGQVQVGKSGFNQVLIKKSDYTGNVIGIIREKEGIY